jgi:hypothetical protein
MPWFWLGKRMAGRYCIRCLVNSEVDDTRVGGNAQRDHVAFDPFAIRMPASKRPATMSVRASLKDKSREISDIARETAE